jgi:LAO/AO transport system kinase
MGGLAMHTAQVCDVLDAAGFDRVLIETVGVGQSELEVAQTADTTAVVLVPESGDAVQAMKAGLMEIADVFVINKSDREGADRASQAIRSALHLRAKTSEWEIPVQQTVATSGKGVDELVERFEQHLAWLGSSGTLDRRRRHRLAQRLEGLVRERLWERFQNGVPDGAWERAVAELGERRKTPNRLAAQLVDGAKPGGAEPD